MKLTTLALSLLAGIGAGWATNSSATPVAISLLPDCFVSNYDAQQDLFTLKNTALDFVNQQCVLTVGPGAPLRPGQASARDAMRFPSPTAAAAAPAEPRKVAIAAARAVAAPGRGRR